MIQLHVSMGIEDDALRLHFSDHRIYLTMRIQNEELALNSIQQLPGLLKAKADQMQLTLDNLDRGKE